MTLEYSKFNEFLENAARDLDITPSKYKQAVERYQAVGKWLDSSEYENYSGSINIYPQGSFRLGTVVRPIREQKELEYDIDLVCEFEQVHLENTPEEIKNRVGNRLRENETYKNMIDKEGRRCWTLIYSEQDNVGFHLDVLPAISSVNVNVDSSILITHKDDSNYSWSTSNPKGYAKWFDNKNRSAFLLAERAQKNIIALNSKDIFASIDDVPDQLVRTPLQRAIQIMKRHRDLRFGVNGDSKYAPISMIITTLAAHLYENEVDLLPTLTGIISRLEQHKVLLSGLIMENKSLADRHLISRQSDGTWYIGNPANNKENFADRWDEDSHARAKAFFKWVTWLTEDFISVLKNDEINVKDSMLSVLGSRVVSRCWNPVFGDDIKVQIPNPRKVEIQHGPRPWRK